VLKMLNVVYARHDHEAHGCIEFDRPLVARLPRTPERVLKDLRKVAQEAS
jgi:hypothetical protein